MRNLILLPLFAISILSSLSFGANLCVSGKPGATNLIDQMKKARAKSALTQNIYSSFNLDQNSKTEGIITAAGCTDCATEKSKNQTDLAELSATASVEQAPAKLTFKKECLISGGSFESSSAEVICPSGERAQGRNLCLTENMLDYQNAVVSSFNSCMRKSGFKTLDAATLFRLYALESAFKPHYAYTGGVGAGQLTSIFVEDIHQQHRGFNYLNTIAKSSQKECSAAQIIASQDTKSKPSLKDTCAFTAVGGGLERNILYTLIGLANSWDKDISPKFNSYSAKYKNDPKLMEAQNLALLNGYGPGGRVAARAAVERLTQLPPEKFIAAIKKPLLKERGRSLSVYINNIEKRQNLLGQKLSEPLKSEFAKVGASACVN